MLHPAKRRSHPLRAIRDPNCKQSVYRRAQICSSSTRAGEGSRHNVGELKAGYVIRRGRCHQIEVDNRPREVIRATCLCVMLRFVDRAQDMF